MVFALKSNSKKKFFFSFSLFLAVKNSKDTSPPVAGFKNVIRVTGKKGHATLKCEILVLGPNLQQFGTTWKM